MWEKPINCKYCKSDFVITELDVKYDDLRNPDFFVPDFQYYVNCPVCKEILIQSAIPSEVAVEIQHRLNEKSSNTNTENK